MSTTEPIQREMMRCGRMPAPSNVSEDGRSFVRNGQTWSFRTAPQLDAGTCAGFASTLPEVLEVVQAYPQWKERTLTEWLGELPTKNLLTSLSMIDAGKVIVEERRREKAKEGGGG